MHKKLPGQESVYKRDLQLSDMGPGRHSCKLIHILLEDGPSRSQIAAYGKGKGQARAPEFILQKPGPRSWSLYSSRENSVGVPASWPGRLSQFSALQTPLHLSLRMDSPASYRHQVFVPTPAREAASSMVQSQLAAA